MSVTILYCNDPVWPRRPDAHFAAEYRLARELGADVKLIDHDAILRGDVTGAISTVPHQIGSVWYRGWMMNVEQYTALDAALRERGAELATSAQRFRAAHEFPGWYPHFAAVTPQSVWVDGVPDDDDLVAMASRLPGPRAMVKDYVKSRKDHPGAFLIADSGDSDVVRSIVSTFVGLQTPDLNGGIVLRHFEDLTGDGGRAHEARVWWLDGRPLVVGPHPDMTDVVVTPDLSAIEPLVASFGARFVTTDLARRSDGVWRLVEVGDGQVSDFPRGHDIAPLLVGLIAAGSSSS